MGAEILVILGLSGILFMAWFMLKIAKDYKTRA